MSERTTVDGLLLRIYVGESDRGDGTALYQAIVARARRAGLIGATVLRGVEGFGAHSEIHTARLLRLAEELPMVVEIVDRPEVVERFADEVAELVEEGMMTLEKVRMIHLRRNR